MSRETARTPTQQRILDAALILFNETGIERVSLYRIAAQVGISQGNLTYHFALKQDLVFALIHQLETEMTLVLSQRRDVTTRSMANYLVTLFRVMWKHRFFFLSFTYLVRDDPLIEESYNRLAMIAQEGSMKRIDDAATVGDIAMIRPPNSSRILAENMWATWINQICIGGRSGPERTEVETIYDCCLHHLSLIHPYAPEGYILRIVRKVEAALGLEPVPYKT